MVGIYRIRNTKNNKSYIGSSKDIEKRFKSHKYLLNKQKHHSKKLQAAWNQFKESSFIFEVIKECKLEDLLNIEQSLINKYNSFKDGYNMTGSTKYIPRTIIKKKYARKSRTTWSESKYKRSKGRFRLR